MTDTKNVSQAAHIIARFGGQTAMAKAMTEARGKKVWPSQIQKFKDKGHIDGEWQPLVLEASQIANAGVTPLDFIIHLVR